MPIDPRAQRLLGMLAAGRAPSAGQETAASRRLSLQALARTVDDSADAVGPIEDVTAPGPGGAMSLRIYTPPSPPKRPLPGLVFLHGGGWVAGGLDTHDGLCRRLAREAHCRVIAVDYRLAPEHRFPAALDDSLAATRWAAAHARDLGIDPARLAVGGDSAGAALAASVCQQARGGGPAIALQVLICPILDVAREAPSRAAYAEGYFLDRATLARDLADYCPPGSDRGDPRLSPLLATHLAGLPPALIHTAEFDPFRDEGLAYAEALAGAGVAVQATRHAGMIHYFYAMPRAIPYAREALAELGRQFRAAMRG